MLLYRLLVGAPYYSQLSNEGTMQRTGSIFSCSLADVDEQCVLLGRNDSFYTFPGKHTLTVNTTNDVIVIQMIYLLSIMALISC